MDFVLNHQLREFSKDNIDDYVEFIRSFSYSPKYKVIRKKVFDLETWLNEKKK